MQHAIFGGSTAARTMNCPAWRQLADQMPPQGSSQFADRGTLLHNAMELILEHEEFNYFQKGFDYSFVIGTTYEGIELTQELFDEKIVPAYESVKEIFEIYGIDDYACEGKVSMHTDAWGTADLLACGDEYFLCLDYKFGDGVQVQAEGNVQGLFYSSAAAITPDFADMYSADKKLVVAIVQPTKNGDHFSCWEPEDFSPERFCLDFVAAMERAKKPDPAPCAGSWCAFCPGEAVCPAKTGELQALNRIDLKDLTMIPTYEELDSMKSTLKAIEKLVHAQMEEGVNIPGFKLVNKRAARVYSDQPAIELKIKKAKRIKMEDAYTYKLKTPAQLEKVLKEKGIDYKEFVGDNVQSVSSGTTLASASDKRAAVVPAQALQALAAKLS